MSVPRGEVKLVKVSEKDIHIGMMLMGTIQVEEHKKRWTLLHLIHTKAK